MRPILGYAAVAVALWIVARTFILWLSNPEMSEMQVFLATWEQQLVLLVCLATASWTLHPEESKPARRQRWGQRA